MSEKDKKMTRVLAFTAGIVLVLGLGTLLALDIGSTIFTGVFELGPGATSDEGGLTNILGNTIDPGPDWADIFDGNGNVISAFGGEAAFVRDDVSAGSLLDRNVYSGGPGDKNSDIIADWTWTSSSVPAKDDISNAYVYTKVVGGHKLLFAGMEREDPSGDSHIDVEFFQSPVGVSGADANGNCLLKQCGFTGTNMNGDVLVNMDFTNGGGFGSLSVRKRHNGVTNNYDPPVTLNGEGCNANAPAGSICGFNNGGSINGGPWPNFDNHAAVITNLPQNAFTEIAIDVTALFNENPCFSTVQVKTRSSQSFTASLKDFALKGFQQCSATVATQIKDSSGNDITGTTVPVLTTIHDTAVVTGTAGFPTPTGTVTFFRFSTIDCTGSSVTETANLSPATPPTATAETVPYTPGPGVLSYNAVYNGDANYPASPISNCEPLTVSRFNSSVTTDIKRDNVNGASVLNTAVNTSGGAVTVYDVAFVTGHIPGPNPTGTVTFAVYTNGACQGTPSTIDINVQGGSPNSGLSSAVAPAVILNAPAGSFLSYAAKYNGDTNYDPSSVSHCEPLCAFPFVSQ